jgi:hypothetical protein
LIYWDRQILGAFLSKILPDWLLAISLVFLLAFTTWTTLDKGLSQWKKESKAQEAERRSELAIASVLKEEDEERAESQPLLSQQSAVVSARIHSSLRQQQQQQDNETVDSESMDGSNGSVGQEERELQALLAAERQTPWEKVRLVSLMVLVVVVLNLLKGGSAGFPSPIGIECGSFGYWLVTGLVFVWVLGISFFARSQLIEDWKRKKRLRFRYLEGDVEWNHINTITYPCICFFAGFFAGMFGIGGGIVKGPLMLYMGVHPLVASATVAVMIMFTSVAATTMFIAFGTLTWDYAWFFFVVGLLATSVGQFGVSYLVQKYRRVSLVSLSIGAVVAISTVLMAVQSVFSLMDSEAEPQSSSVCGK